MSRKVIDKLILNSPFKEPKQYWQYIRETQDFEIRDGRRSSGYWRAIGGKDFKNREDPGEFIEIELVNKIRQRVKSWREDDYPNITPTTRDLLKYWHNTQRERRLFWCQLEAVETAIWLTEATPADKQGIEITNDNSHWKRECLKLATGTGKTVVMAMLILWQALNKIHNPRDTRFSKYILVISPGLTIKDRLQVLLPEKEDNFYQQFDLVPSGMLDTFLGAKIEILNWHKLMPKEDPKNSVIKRGEESDRAFVNRVLSKFRSNVLVINDEAHHCHRPTEDEEKEEREKATIWINGIDRIHRACNVIKAYDLTATPFKPTGKSNQSEQLFTWIVSDFGLNDSIESGLVKTPMIAVRDDSELTPDLKSKFFHIYIHVKEELKGKGRKPLPTLVKNAVRILGASWEKTREDWEREGRSTPPVMIMIANRADTATRLENFLQEDPIVVPRLKEEVLHIDQKALDKLEAGEEQENKTKRKLVEEEREKFNTVGRENKPGAQVTCVIGVNMLSEGWDARTVKQILGLRAFTSQLLCEQVVGRGLRRISYDLNPQTGLFDAEYVTVFGIPFTFLPIEEKDEREVKVLEKPKVKVEALKEREHLKIEWPNIVRISYKTVYFLDCDWDKLPTLPLSTRDDSPTVVERAVPLEDHINYDTIDRMDNRVGGRFQTIKLKLVRKTLQQLRVSKREWTLNLSFVLCELVRIMDEFFESDKLILEGVPDEKSKSNLICMNMERIVGHLWHHITGTKGTVPVAIFDDSHPKWGTSFVKKPWYTSKRVQRVYKSHMSHMVVDSVWEGSVGFELERDRIEGLESWVRNEQRIGFVIFYLWEGMECKYYPDFILRFTDNRYVIVEVKGLQLRREQDAAKWSAVRKWVEAVNRCTVFGNWSFSVIHKPTEVCNILQ